MANRQITLRDHLMADVSPALSRTTTMASRPDSQPRMSNARRLVLLLLFCLAQFMDAFSNTAIFSALPRLKESMGMDEGEATWVISAFGLTFASFLLVSGRISDLYNPSQYQYSHLATLLTSNIRANPHGQNRCSWSV